MATMNKIDIDNLLKYGEHVHLECKKATHDLPKSVWETYSSFANTGGGDILLGVEEVSQKGTLFPEFHVSGVTNAKQIIKTIWDTVNNESKVSLSLLHDEDVQAVEYDDKRTVIVIHVPQASYRERPIYINENPLKGTFKRNYEGDYRCDESEVKAMLRDANDDGNDGILIEYHDMNDIDIPTLRNYRNEFENRNIGHAYNQLDDKEFLRQMGGYTIDRVTRKEGLTLAGLMMFGKGLSVRERFSNFRMDYVDMSNLHGDMRYSDRLTYDGRWENNLYNFFRQVLTRLTDGLKRPFRLEGMQRNDDTPAHKAIREALANSIIHADFFVASSVLRIEKHDSRICFRNPGTLKLPVARIYEGGSSKARNPRIQNMLRMIGFGENLGSGFPTILNACKQEQWRKPDLCENQDLREVVLNLWMISMYPKSVETELRHLFGTTYNRFSADECSALSVAWVEQEVTNERLQTLLEKNSLQVAKLLRNLTEVEALTAEQNGRWTTYHINTDFKELSNGVPNGVSNGVSNSDSTTMAVLKLIQNNPYISRKEIATEIGIAIKTVQKHINKLKYHGLIRRSGPATRGGYWEITE